MGNIKLLISFLGITIYLLAGKLINISQNIELTKQGYYNVEWEVCQCYGVGLLGNPQSLAFLTTIGYNHCNSDPQIQEGDSMHRKIVFVVLAVLLAVLVFTANREVAAQQGGCITVDLNAETSYPLITIWPPDTTGDVCLLVTFTTLQEDKVFSFEGWVFGDPIYLNGELLETYEAPGELAKQITRKEVVVSNTTTLEFILTKPAPGYELGLWWEIKDIAQPDPTPTPPPAEYKVYIPLVLKADTFPPSGALTVTEQFTSAKSLYLKSWPEAPANQVACMQIAFATPFTGRVYRLWFFGDWLRVQVNGDFLDVAARSVPGELAMQAGPFNLSKATSLVVCTNGPGQGREIGVVIYQ